MSALQLLRVPLTLTEPERKVLDLMMENETSTAACAAALNLDHVPVQEQCNKVKKVKDAVGHKIKRHPWRFSKLFAGALFILMCELPESAAVWHALCRAFARRHWPAAERGKVF